ncbi:hypothetical protein BDV06DRAFT_213049 [Aspergillus oleicola]
MQKQGSSRVSKPIRRNRIPLSCEGCRSRKYVPRNALRTTRNVDRVRLKCNREKPCQNCSARGETCYFKGSTNGGTATQTRDRTGETMRQRIDHLEDMVKKLIEQHPTMPSPNESQGSVSSGKLDSGSGRLGTTIVNELKEVWKDVEDEADAMPALSNSVDGTSLLFNQVERADMQTILSSLPPKAEADRLLQWFFDRTNFPIAVPPIIHEPTFMREYEEHWKNPTQTSIMWIGLLFSVLGITMLASQFGGLQFEGAPEDQFHLYRLRTAQCLLMGDIAKCLPYTIETLRFNATAELNRKDDNSRGLWIMTGVLVRAAVNMGYHRDPDHTPSLSVLKAEYRRRVWLSVLSMDEVASFLSGFPRMTSALNSDTKEPRSLYDWELDDKTSVLPPSRPTSELTPGTYLIVKGRLFHALGDIIDFINGPNPDDYEKAMEIDRLLYETWSNIPSYMRLEDGQLDNLQLRHPADYSNFQLICMYHHGVCLLHRKFVRTPNSISHSRVVGSSLELINYQRFLAPSWYAFSRTRQMLAPAAMTLLLELETRKRAADTQLVLKTDGLLQALRGAVSLWGSASSSCGEAAKMYGLLHTMLRAYETPSDGSSVESIFLQPDTTDVPNSNPIFNLSGKDIDWAWWDEIIDGSGLWD